VNVSRDSQSVYIDIFILQQCDNGVLRRISSCVEFVDILYRNHSFYRSYMFALYLL